MAANIKDEDERDRRIIMIGEFIIQHPEMSTRKVAEYFSKNYFSISNATVYDYFERYKQMRPDDIKTIEQIMYNNRAKGIKDENIVERVKKVTRKLLEEDKTVNQIAEELKIGFWTVYYDLTERLPLLNGELYRLVEERMSERVIKNIDKTRK